jgi:hypothetical protein
MRCVFMVLTPNRALMDGKAEFKTWKNSRGEEEGLHEDLCAAKQTVQHLQTLENVYGAHIALAHDSTWMLSGTDKTLMSLLDADLLDFAKTGLPHGGFP